MNTDNIKLNGTVIQGGSLRYPKTPNLLLGENKGYERGDILDANAVSKLIEEGGGGGDPEEIEKIKLDLQKKADKTELPTKVSDLENDSQFVTADAIEGYGERLDNLDEQMSTKASESYVDDAVSQMGDALDNAKVDKVEGKDLSTNDYTDEDKAKVDSITPQVQADWAENDTTSKSYIENRTHYEEYAALYTVNINRNVNIHDGGGMSDGTFFFISGTNIPSNYRIYPKDVKIDGYEVVFKNRSSSSTAKDIVLKVSDDESQWVKIGYCTWDNMYTIGNTEEFYNYNKIEIFDNIIHKLDNKYLNIDTQLSTASNNPVSNKAITAMTNSLGTLINETRSNLNNYYTKSQTYSQAEIDALLDAARNGLFVLVTELPEPSADCIGKIYLIDATTTQESNYKDEYICFYKQDTEEYSWEKIGSTTVNLDNYYTKPEVDELVELSKVLSDWNENNSIQKSYIANRTHYVEKEPVIESFVDEPVSITLLEKLELFPEVKDELDNYYNTQVRVNLSIGNYSEEYLVPLREDDVSYFKVKTKLKYKTSGEFIKLKAEHYDSPEYIIYFDSSAMLLKIGDSDTHSSPYIIDLIGEDVVHKLDNKYIDSSSIVDSTSELPVQTKAVAEYVDSKEQSITNYIDSKLFLKYYDYNSKTTFTVPALGSETPYTVQVDLPSDLTADWRIGGVMTHAIKDANGNRIYASIVLSFTMLDQTAIKVSFMGCSSSAKQAAELLIKFILIKR